MPKKNNTIPAQRQIVLIGCPNFVVKANAILNHPKGIAIPPEIINLSFILMDKFKDNLYHSVIARSTTKQFLFRLPHYTAFRLQ